MRKEILSAIRRRYFLWSVVLRFLWCVKAKAKMFTLASSDVRGFARDLSIESLIDNEETEDGGEDQESADYQGARN